MPREHSIDLSRHSFREAVLLKRGRVNLTDNSIIKILLLAHEHFRYTDFDVTGVSIDELRCGILRAFLDEIAHGNNINNSEQQLSLIDRLLSYHGTWGNVFNRLVSIRYFIEQVESVTDEINRVNSHSRNRISRIIQVALNSARGTYSDLRYMFATHVILNVYNDLVMQTHHAEIILEQYFDDLIRGNIQRLFPGRPTVSICRKINIRENLFSYTANNLTEMETLYQYSSTNGLHIQRRLSQQPVLPAEPDPLNQHPIRHAPWDNPAPEDAPNNNLMSSLMLKMAILEERKDRSKNTSEESFTPVTVYHHNDSFLSEEECREQGLTVNNPIVIKHISEGEYLALCNKLQENYINIDRRAFNYYINT